MATNGDCADLRKGSRNVQGASKVPRQKRKRKGSVRVVDSIVRSSDNHENQKRTKVGDKSSSPKDYEVQGECDEVAVVEGSYNSSARSSMKTCLSTAKPTLDLRSVEERGTVACTSSTPIVSTPTLSTPTMSTPTISEGQEDDTRLEAAPKTTGNEGHPQCKVNVAYAMEKRIEQLIKRNHTEVVRMFSTRLERNEEMIAALRKDIGTMKDLMEAGVAYPTVGGKKEVALSGVEFFRFLFHRNLLQNVAEVCVVGRTMKILNDANGGSYLEKISLSIQSIMFSKLPENPKTEFHSRVGTQYCLLRRSMVRTALSLVVKDVYKKFKAGNNEAEGGREEC